MLRPMLHCLTHEPTVPAHTYSDALKVSMGLTDAANTLRVFNWATLIYGAGNAEWLMKEALGALLLRCRPDMTVRELQDAAMETIRIQAREGR